MRRALLPVLLALACLYWSLLFASSSPDDRPLTDPKSVSSESKAGAHPVPIADLYYTRLAFGAAWSPDGSEVVFTTDMSGRLNLWKVKASGGWPLELTQSDERQFGAA